MQRKPREANKKRAHGGNGYVSIQQWADQSVGFSAANGYVAEEIVLQIQENPYLQYFCGYTGYDGSKPPFDRPPWFISGNA